MGVFVEILLALVKANMLPNLTPKEWSIVLSVPIVSKWSDCIRSSDDNSISSSTTHHRDYNWCGRMLSA